MAHYIKQNPHDWTVRVVYALFLANIFMPLAVYGIQDPAQGKVAQARLIPWLTDAQIEEGWLSLFDGQTLFGWKEESDANWRVVDGCIEVSTGAPGLLRTTSQFDEFDLRLQFKTSVNTDSGVFFRTSPKPKHPASDCYEINLAPATTSGFPTGSLMARQKCEPRDSSPPPKHNGFEDGNWHSLRILAKANHIKVWVDDIWLIDYRDPRPLGRGYVALEKGKGPIAFRNIILRPINQKDLFDRKSLVGWNVEQRKTSSISVNNKGEMRIQNGPGQIESDSRFADFVFTTQCRTASPGLNSGVFFRCIPGELMNGYESQIQNQFKDNNPAIPVDCGTGGIFRRQNARRVNAADQVWFTKTIVAVGPHISVWVNGFQVSDWTDKRKPHKNPRKGTRLDSGTFIFQGHDPTTDILFRNIRAKELLRRRFAADK